MLLAWLLPDASEATPRDGWAKQAYRPRHGRPPLIVRAGQSGAAALSGARIWYLGGEQDDAELQLPIDNLGLNSEIG